MATSLANTVLHSNNARVEVYAAVQKRGGRAELLIVRRVCHSYSFYSVVFFCGLLLWRVRELRHPVVWYQLCCYSHKRMDDLLPSQLGQQHNRWLNIA